jgi:hypothetical protein
MTAGTSQKFRWSGTLQGDSSARNRSYFRLELLKSGESSWASADYTITEAGASINELTRAVPAAGSYRWRVCAYGVEDVSVSNAITELACSSQFDMVSTAAPTSQIEANPTPVVVERTRVVKLPDRRETRTRSTGPSRAAAPTETIVRRLPPEPVSFADTAERDSAGEAVKDAVKKATPNAGVASEERGVGAAISNGLNATLPGLPVPFWALALLTISVPATLLWRKSLMAMFEWDDDTEDLLDLDAGSQPSDSESFAA